MSPAFTSGITGAAPIWHEIMATILKDTEDSKQPMPEAVVARRCFGKMEYFIKGTEPKERCGFSRPSPSGYSRED